MRCFTEFSAFLGRCHLDMINFARARLHEQIKSPEPCSRFSAFIRLGLPLLYSRTISDSSIPTTPIYNPIDRSRLMDS
jgi:hypothetical protein